MMCVGDGVDIPDVGRVSKAYTSSIPGEACVVHGVDISDAGK
jgi:hypothetical protein